MRYLSPILNEASSSYQNIVQNSCLVPPPRWPDCQCSQHPHRTLPMQPPESDKCKCWKNVKNAAPALMQEVMIRHSWDTCRQSRRWVMEWLPPPNLAMQHFLHNHPQVLSHDFKVSISKNGLYLMQGCDYAEAACCHQLQMFDIAQNLSEDLLHQSVSSI